MIDTAASSSSPCYTNPCRNGGTCHDDLINWTYQCACTDRFTGNNCENGKSSGLTSHQSVVETCLPDHVLILYEEIMCYHRQGLI